MPEVAQVRLLRGRAVVLERQRPFGHEEHLIGFELRLGLGLGLGLGLALGLGLGLGLGLEDELRTKVRGASARLATREQVQEECKGLLGRATPGWGQG